MPGPGVVTGSTNALSTLGNLILMIRDDIPDIVDSPTDDGTFSFSTLLRWISDTMDEMCSTAPVIVDWYAIASEAGMDVYEIPNHITQVNQLWYDNWPCWRAPEIDALFVTKVQSRSYFFGPHAVHATPRLHVWPCADRTGAVTTLATPVGPTDKTIVLTDSSGFRPYGYFKLDDEIVLYRTITGNTVTNILRGQGGTVPVAHIATAPAVELNIMFQCNRLANPVEVISDVIEVPRSLWPVLELGVMAKVRNAEQEFQEARALRQEFDKTVEKIAQRAANKLRQGIQVRTEPPGPLYYFGRVYVP